MELKIETRKSFNLSTSFKPFGTTRIQRGLRKTHLNRKSLPRDNLLLNYTILIIYRNSKELIRPANLSNSLRIRSKRTQIKTPKNDPNRANLKIILLKINFFYNVLFRLLIQNPQLVENLPKIQP
jgi:hypothetical protein